MHVLVVSGTHNSSILGRRMRPVGFPLRQARRENAVFMPFTLGFKTSARCPLSQARSGDVEDWRGGGGEASGRGLPPQGLQRRLCWEHRFARLCCIVQRTATGRPRHQNMWNLHGTSGPTVRHEHQASFRFNASSLCVSLFLSPESQP